MPTSKPAHEQLEHLLRTGHVLTTREAADRLNVSTRTILRAAKKLEGRGLPVETTHVGNMNQYALSEAERYPESGDRYTENQLLALIVAIEAGRSLLRPTPLTAPLKAVYDDLMTRIPEQNVFTLDPNEESSRWYFQEARSVPIDPDIFETVRQAIHEQRTISIDYMNASRQTRNKGRVIDPLVIGTQNGAWLCVAYCHMREDIRDFNLVDIQSIEVHDTHFEPPEDFDPILHFDKRFGATTGESYLVRIRVAPEVAGYFRRKKYHPTQQVDHEGSDGHLIVSYDVEGLKDMHSWIRSWGPAVTVLEPEKLAQQIQEDAEAVAAQYASQA
ncbi:helix-turn-helix transcriptional regulator [Longimonas halophila]|nr:transcriptional regulator [Longimonas halophila]